MLEVLINGSPRQVPENLNLRALLEFLGLPADRVAVERNREIVNKSKWENVVVQAGDRLEIVHFVGGG